MEVICTSLDIVQDEWQEVDLGIEGGTVEGY